MVSVVQNEGVLLPPPPPQDPYYYSILQCLKWKQYAKHRWPTPRKYNHSLCNQVLILGQPVLKDNCLPVPQYVSHYLLRHMSLKEANTTHLYLHFILWVHNATMYLHQARQFHIWAGVNIIAHTVNIQILWHQDGEFDYWQPDKMMFKWFSLTGSLMLLYCLSLSSRHLYQIHKTINNTTIKSSTSYPVQCHNRRSAFNASSWPQ